jgi:hypothetical protein
MRAAHRSKQMLTRCCPCTTSTNDHLLCQRTSIAGSRAIGFAEHERHHSFQLASFIATCISNDWQGGPHLGLLHHAALHQWAKAGVGRHLGADLNNEEIPPLIPDHRSNALEDSAGFQGVYVWEGGMM